ncbi:phospholipase A2 inhibitor and Ly6/PLAUR domain-containing protein-like [Emydura macquarii macquarii]|uniref:phospholipase A2 inhibitor and Ly6/PLAUR domain-containing protein-like n=1 Tax=Emydura macquarii macquarii TaxID=1129001 RepID=UPI00352BD12E
MRGSLILGLLAVLLPAAKGQFLCSLCTSSLANCSTNTETCKVTSLQGACIFTLETVSSGGNDKENVHAACVEDRAACRANLLSLTVGTDTRVRANSVCCQGDKCNQNLTVAVPSNSTATNGLQCVACDAPNADECKDNLNVPCMGSEDHCIDFAGTLAANTNTTLILKGCATQSACELKVNESFYYSQNTYTLTKANCLPATSKGSTTAVHALAFFSMLAGLLLVKQLS